MIDMVDYVYRKLSPDERKSLVDKRRQQGYPYHAPPHPYRDAGTYLITAICYEHQMILVDPDRRTDFEIKMLQAMDSVHAEVNAWTILPNHYHVLIAVDTLNDISMALKRLHGSSSHAWNLKDELTGKRKVWYKYYDRAIRSENHFYQALNYIHFNSVKHNWVNDPYEWIWCSLEIYREKYGRDWLRLKWKENPVGRYGKGWDD
jgi:putative transposase